MRWIIAAFGLLLLTACTPSDMKREGRHYLADAGLLDNYRITRSVNMRLQPDAQLYVAQSHFVPAGHAYARPNILAEEAFAAAVKVFPLVRRAGQPLGLDEALNAAWALGLDYVLYTRFAGVQSSGGAEQSAEGTARGSVGRDQVTLQLMLMETATRRIIDFAAIENNTGFLAFYRSRPEDLLREPMEAYTRQLLGNH